MKLETAKKIAHDFMEQISPFCLRTESAGSVRRGKSEIQDIDICAIPKALFGLKTVMDRQHYIRGRFPSRNSQIKFKGEKIDIFWCSRENWGNIFLIRTGPWEFSKWIMGTRARIRGLIHNEGYLWRGSERLCCLEEKDVFEAVGLPYIEPNERLGRGENDAGNF